MFSVDLYYKKLMPVLCLHAGSETRDRCTWNWTAFIYYSSKRISFVSIFKYLNVFLLILLLSKKVDDYQSRETWVRLHYRVIPQDFIIIIPSFILW